MEAIGDIRKIAARLNTSQLEMLETAALMHLQYSNIIFKIVKFKDGVLTVRTVQGFSLAENYADKKTLIGRTRELFSPFFPDVQIHVHPVLYGK